MHLDAVDFFFFFFKQKTAYEMRISDWSSDVCSSDLDHHRDDLGDRTLYRFQDLLERFFPGHAGARRPGAAGEGQRQADGSADEEDGTAIGNLQGRCTHGSSPWGWTVGSGVMSTRP